MRVEGQKQKMTEMHTVKCKGNNKDYADADEGTLSKDVLYSHNKRLYV